MNPAVWIDPQMANWIVISLAHVLWQGLLIAGLAMLAASGLRQYSAQSRYGVYCAALLLLVACWPANLWLTAPYQHVSSPPPSVEEAVETIVAAPQPAMSEASVALDTAAAEIVVAPIADLEVASAVIPAPPSLLDFSSLWPTLSPWLVELYMLGAALMALRLVMGLYGSQRLRTSAEPVHGSHLQADLARLAQRVGLSVAPVVAMSARVTTPLVVGVLKPAILLPTAMLSGLRPDQVEALLLHELAHIRRYDHVVNLLQRIVETLLFFHPAVWWLSSRISLEREHCCDDLAVAWGGDACDYAESLVRVSELRFQAAGLGPASATVLAAAGGQPSRLQRRVLRVLGMPLAGPTIGLTRLGMATLLVASLSTAAIIANQDQPDDAVPVAEPVPLAAAATPTPEFVANEADAPEVAAIETDVPELVTPEDPTAIVIGSAVAVAPAPATAPVSATAPMDAPAPATTIGAQTGVMTMAVTVPSSDEPDTESATSSRIRQRHFVRVVVGKDQITVEGTSRKLPFEARLKAVPNRPHTVLEYATTPDCTRDMQDQVFALALKLGFEYFSLVGTHPLDSIGSPSEYVVFDPKREAALQVVLRDIKRMPHRERVQVVLLPEGHLRIEGHLIERDQLLRVLRAFPRSTKKRLQVVRMVNSNAPLPTLSRFLGQDCDEQMNRELWNVIAEVIGFNEVRWVTVDSDDKYWDLKLALIGVWSGPGPEKLSLIFNPSNKYTDMFGEEGAWRLDKTTLQREITASPDRQKIGRQINQQVVQLDDDELVLQDGEQTLHLYRAIDFYNQTLQRFHSTTDPAELPDLFEETPAGSKSYEIRDDVQVVYCDTDGTVYWLPGKSTYYVQAGAVGESQLRIYGPYRGDPRESLDLPKHGVALAQHQAAMAAHHEDLQRQQQAVAQQRLASAKHKAQQAAEAEAPSLAATQAQFEMGAAQLDLAKLDQDLPKQREALEQLIVLAEQQRDQTQELIKAGRLPASALNEATEHVAELQLKYAELQQTSSVVAAISNIQSQRPRADSIEPEAKQKMQQAREEVQRRRLALAELQVANASEQLERVKKMYANGATPQADLAKAEEAYCVARENLAKAHDDKQAQLEQLHRQLELHVQTLELRKQQVDAGVEAPAELQQTLEDIARLNVQIAEVEEQIKAAALSASEVNPSAAVTVNEPEAVQQAREEVQRQRILLAQLQFETTMEALEQTKRQYEEGRAPKADLARAQEANYVARENLAKAHDDKRTQLEMLQNQLGVRIEYLEWLKKLVESGRASQRELNETKVEIAKLRVRMAEVEQLIRQDEATSAVTTSGQRGD